jgi:hypothetical protein
MDDKGGYRQINKSLNICAFEEYLKGQTANLPELADVEQVTPRVLRVLGQNPGKVIHNNRFDVSRAKHSYISSLFKGPILTLLALDVIEL